MKVGKMSLQHFVALSIPLLGNDGMSLAFAPAFVKKTAISFSLNAQANDNDEAPREDVKRTVASSSGVKPNFMDYTEIKNDEAYGSGRNVNENSRKTVSSFNINNHVQLNDEAYGSGQPVPEQSRRVVSSFNVNDHVQLNDEAYGSGQYVPEESRRKVTPFNVNDHVELNDEAYGTGSYVPEESRRKVSSFNINEEVNDKDKMTRGIVKKAISSISAMGQAETSYDVFLGENDLVDENDEVLNENMEETGAALNVNDQTTLENIDQTVENDEVLQGYVEETDASFDTNVQVEPTVDVKKSVVSSSGIMPNFMDFTEIKNDEAYGSGQPVPEQSRRFVSSFNVNDHVQLNDEAYGSGQYVPEESRRKVTPFNVNDYTPYGDGGPARRNASSFGGVVKKTVTSSSVNDQVVPKDDTMKSDPMSLADNDLIDENDDVEVLSEDVKETATSMNMDIQDNDNDEVLQGDIEETVTSLLNPNDQVEPIDDLLREDVKKSVVSSSGIKPNFMDFTEIKNDESYGSGQPVPEQSRRVVSSFNVNDYTPYGDGGPARRNASSFSGVVKKTVTSSSVNDQVVPKGDNVNKTGRSLGIKPNFMGYTEIKEDEVYGGSARKTASSFNINDDAKDDDLTSRGIVKKTIISSPVIDQVEPEVSLGGVENTDPSMNIINEFEGLYLEDKDLMNKIDQALNGNREETGPSSGTNDKISLENIDQVEDNDEELCDEKEEEVTLSNTNIQADDNAKLLNVDDKKALTASGIKPNFMDFTEIKNDEAYGSGRVIHENSRKIVSSFNVNDHVELNDEAYGGSRRKRSTSFNINDI